MLSQARRGCENCVGQWATEGSVVAVGLFIIAMFLESLILLLSVYAKSNQVDMDAAEKKILSATVQQYFKE